MTRMTVTSRPVPSDGRPARRAPWHRRHARRHSPARRVRPSRARSAARRSSPTPWPATRTRRRVSTSPSPRSMPAPTCWRLGLPYSDPLADGTTLQRALGRGAADTGPRSSARWSSCGRVHAARPETPLVPMGYVNQVLGDRDARRPPRAARGGRGERRHPGRPDTGRGRRPGGGGAATAGLAHRLPRDAHDAPDRAARSSPRARAASCTPSRWPASPAPAAICPAA